jgi:hypothetical protein
MENSTLNVVVRYFYDGSAGNIILQAKKLFFFFKYKRQFLFSFIVFSKQQVF